MSRQYDYDSQQPGAGTADALRALSRVGQRGKAHTVIKKQLTPLDLPMNLGPERLALLDHLRQHPIVVLSVGSLRAHTVPCRSILLLMIKVKLPGIVPVS